MFKLLTPTQNYTRFDFFDPKRDYDHRIIAADFADKYNAITKNPTRAWLDELRNTQRLAYVGISQYHEIVANIQFLQGYVYLEDIGKSPDLFKYVYDVTKAVLSHNNEGESIGQNIVRPQIYLGDYTA